MESVGYFVSHLLFLVGRSAPKVGQDNPIYGNFRTSTFRRKMA